MHAAAARECPWRIREWAMVALKIGEGGIPAMARVDIEHDEATARGYADVRAQPCFPPAPHCGG